MRWRGWPAAPRPRARRARRHGRHQLLRRPVDRRGGPCRRSATSVAFVRVVRRPRRPARACCSTSPPATRRRSRRRDAPAARLRRRGHPLQPAPIRWCRRRRSSRCARASRRSCSRRSSRSSDMNQRERDLRKGARDGQGTARAVAHLLTYVNDRDVKKLGAVLVPHLGHSGRDPGRCHRSAHPRRPPRRCSCCTATTTRSSRPPNRRSWATYLRRARR